MICWFFFSGITDILKWNQSNGGKGMSERKPEMLMGALLLVFVFLISRHAGMMAAGQKVVAEEERPVVVIDSGHGGTFYRPE